MARELPIIFSGPMVLAILEGLKTQTRRIIKPQPQPVTAQSGHLAAPGLWCKGDVCWPLGDGRSIVSNKPGPHPEWVARWVKIAAGDRLWVREIFSGPHRYAGIRPGLWEDGAIWYWADGDPTDGDWTKPKPGIHMPRWASRLLLHVKQVRVEPLQSISTQDVRAEGITVRQIDLHGMDAFDRQRYHRALFRNLWESIHGAGAWEKNPWVLAITFEVEKIR